MNYACICSSYNILKTLYSTITRINEIKKYSNPKLIPALLDNLRHFSYSVNEKFATKKSLKPVAFQRISCYLYDLNQIEKVAKIKRNIMNRMNQIFLTLIGNFF